jgi:hypothetical protein
MIDLRKSYLETREKAVQLMKQGKLSAYIAQLAVLQELRLQIMNYAHSTR